MRFAFLPLLLVTAVARGQDSLADRIGPFLTDDALVVGRVDLTTLNVDAAFDRIAPFFPPDAGADVARRMAGGAVAGLREAGVVEVFAVVSPADLPTEGPYYILPISDRVKAGALRERLGAENHPLRKLGDVTELLEGAVFVGPQATLDRLRERKAGATRAGLAEAFSAVEDAPVQILLTPSEEARRVLREMLPDLPPDFGGATGEQIAAGLRWAAIGLRFERQLAARFVIQGESEEAAETLKTTITAGLRRLSTMPEVVAAFPPIPLFVGSLIPERQGDRLVLVPDAAIEAAGNLLAGAAGAARQAAGRAQGMNNLKQIGLAFHNFHDTYGSFPPSAGYAGEKPLLSWRVYLLPWLGQAALYKEFRLDEPWDSEHNRKLVERMPDVFRSPGVEVPAGHTVYLVPTGEGLAFGSKQGLPIKGITDGTSNTILVIEAAAERAVPWTKPDDLAIDFANPLAGIAGGRENFGVLFGDGSARTVPAGVDRQVFLKGLTPAGGEPVDWDEVK